MSLEHLLFATDSSLVRQAYSPRFMSSFLNLAGFGMAVWDAGSPSPETPLMYRATSVPVFDRNVRSLAVKLTPTCLVAHVRGVTYSAEEIISEQNLHPFRYAGVSVALAHNGHLREFARMRQDLLGYVKPEFAQRIEGTTDSECLYVVATRFSFDYGWYPDNDALVEADLPYVSL